MERHNEAMATFTTTQRGKPKLCLNGYRYIVDVRRGSKTYWKCEEKNCKGRVLNEGEEYVERKDHSHAPDVAVTEVKLRFCKM